MPTLIEEIRKARREGELPLLFRFEHVRAACPGWSYSYTEKILPAHCIDNPKGKAEYFYRHERGLYSLTSTK